MSTSRHLLAAAPLALACVLSACGLSGTDRNKDDGTDKATADAGSASDWRDDPMASRDPQPGSQADPSMADDKPRPTMQAQVVLDRLGFGPGVIDGKMGLSTRNALEGFQKANNLNASGELDEPTKQALSRWSNIPATRVVTIPQEFANEPFQPVPDKPEEQAKLQRLGYASLDEKLAERFHTTIDVLKELNAGGASASPGGASASPSPGATATPTPSPSPSPRASPSGSPTPGATASAPAASVFQAGQTIRVPNIGGDRIEPAAVKDRDWLATLQMLGVGTQQPKADKVVVDKSEGVLEAYDAGGKLIAVFTVTSGSRRDPLPLGDWKILAVSHNPHFAYNPELFWDVPDSEEKQQLPPGPNGPVGVVWIDLSKEHYGIHGTPEPETIGRAQSHGCVRLTNWDAARLAQMVSTSTKVSFVA